MFDDKVDCICYGEDGSCICSNHERVIRHYAYGKLSRPMTKQEREWCIEEADDAGEGYYSQEELKKMPDKELAHAVLDAWNMYVQSNVL